MVSQVSIRNTNFRHYNGQVNFHCKEVLLCSESSASQGKFDGLRVQYLVCSRFRRYVHIILIDKDLQHVLHLLNS